MIGDSSWGPVFSKAVLTMGYLVKIRIQTQVSDEKKMENINIPWFKNVKLAPRERLAFKIMNISLYFFEFSLRLISVPGIYRPIECEISTLNGLSFCPFVRSWTMSGSLRMLLCQKIRFLWGKKGVKKWIFFSGPGAHQGGGGERSTCVRGWHTQLQNHSGSLRLLHLEYPNR